MDFDFLTGVGIQGQKNEEAPIQLPPVQESVKTQEND